MGHIVPGMVLKNALELRGHQVTWEICPAKENSPAKIEIWYERFQEMVPNSRQKLLHQLGRDDFDLLVTDPCILAGWDLHFRSGIPWAIFSNLPIFFVDQHVPLFIQCSLPEFEPFRNSNIEFVGPAMPTEVIPAGKLPAFRHMKRFKKSLIGVTQGTVAQDRNDLIHPTTFAVDETMHLVDKFFNYAHHMHLLDCFVTNGGFGSVQMAIYHGVPIVVCGETEDKPYVGKRVAEMGVGINLKFPTDQGYLSAAIHECLHNKKIKARCKEMAEKCRNYSIYQAVDALESLAFGQRQRMAYGRN